ncbi:MAG: hypothetical protein KDK66_05760 [Deltaproteobacteria bacterium]|nr:hypothetical protein [Deltaproteobacteria bacterium]
MKAFLFLSKKGPFKSKRLIFFSLLLAFSFFPAKGLFSESKKDPSILEEALTFREQGPEGLEAFKQKFGKLLSIERDKPQASAEVIRLRQVLDQICQQKDCDYDYLYWYTDFTQAQEAAKKTHKPILSLRLLGELDEDLSCANSRFFRLVLYSYPEIASYLRENFILYWESVRPAPKLTIDYGHGTKIITTITGNSIHYILSPEGKILDALPGLYDPQTFLKKLKGYVVDSKVSNHKEHYSKLYQDLEKQWELSIQKSGLPRISLGAWLSSTGISADLFNQEMSAEEAAKLAISKRMVEIPNLAAFRDQAVPPSPVSIDPYLVYLALNQKPLVQLNPNSIQLLKRKSPQLFANRCVDLKSCPLIENLQKTLGEDTVQNDFLLRPQIIKYLINHPDISIKELNDWVYAKVFLSSQEDPWMGLKPVNLTGVPNEGVIQPDQ